MSLLVFLHVQDFRQPILRLQEVNQIAFYSQNGFPVYRMGDEGYIDFTNVYFVFEELGWDQWMLQKIMDSPFHKQNNTNRLDYFSHLSIARSELIAPQYIGMSYWIPKIRAAKDHRREPLIKIILPKPHMTIDHMTSLFHGHLE